MRQPFRIGIVLGVVVGVALAGAVLGIGTTHIVCSAGPVLGQSGTLVAPWEVEIAPPGGYVNMSYQVQTVFNQSLTVGFGGWNDVPLNSTHADVSGYNWTLRGEQASVVAGWGPDPACTGRTLVATPALANGSSGCAGCPVGASVPAGVGERTVVPTQFSYNGVPSVLINASYGATPVADFSWDVTDGAPVWSNPGDFDGLPVSLGPFYEAGRLYGLGITISFTSLGFEVPIVLTSGQTIDLPASFPAAFSPGIGATTTLSEVMTYILPATSGQGTWAVYLPGNGGPYSLGGLLFEQTATG